MGRFDSIQKFLGKEDMFPPDQIKSGLDTMDESYDVSSITDIPDDHLAAADNLLNFFGNNSNEAETPLADTDAAAAGSTLPGRPELPSASDSAVMDADATEGVDPDILKELTHLDSPPPSLEDLEKMLQEKRQQMEQSEETGTEYNLESETAISMPDMQSELDYEIDTGGGIPGIENNADEIPVSGGSTEETENGVSDLLRSLQREQTDSGMVSVEGPGGPSAPEVDHEFMGLSDLLGGGETIPSREESGPAMESPVSQSEFELPDLDALGGMEAPASASGETAGGGMSELPDFDFSSITGGESASAEAEMEMPILGGGEEMELPPMDAQEVPVFSDQVEPAAFEMPAFGGRMETSAPVSADEGFLNADKIARVRTRINEFSDSMVRRMTRKAILENKLAASDLKNLVDLVLSYASEGEVASFLSRFESQIGPMEMPRRTVRDEIPFSIPEESEPYQQPAGGGRRVLYADESSRNAGRGVAPGAGIIFLLAFIGVVVLGILLNFLVFVPWDTNRTYTAGVKAISNEQYTIAEQKFETARRRGGPDLKWYNIYAREYLNQKRFDMARKKYDEALRIKPGDKTTTFNYADFYKSLYPRQYEQAIALYDKMLNKDPGDFDVLDRKGMTYIQWGTEAQNTNYWREAYNIYIKHLAKNERHLSSYFRLLYLALLVKDKTQIDGLYDAIEKINPKAYELSTYNLLSRYYIDTQAMDRAKKVLYKLLSVKPKNDTNFSETFYQYGRFMTINLDYVNAITSLNDSLKFDPNNARAYNLIGEIYFINKSIPNRLELSVKNFENARSLAPNFYRPYANLGHIFFYQNLAELDLTNSVPLTSSISEQNFSRSFEYYKTARALLPRDTRDFELSYNLSWLYHHFGLYNEAFRELADLYIDEPYNPALSFVSASIYFHLTNFSMAKLQYDKTIEYYQAIADKIAYINPNLDRHKEIYTQLARSYNNRGVLYTYWARSAGRQQAAQYEQKALLDFYKSKEIANRINMVPYNFAEFNIKNVLNKSIQGRLPAFDNYIPMQSIVRDLLDIFKDKLMKYVE